MSLQHIPRSQSILKITMGRNWRNGNHCFKEFGVQEANASRKRDVQLGNVFKLSNIDILKLFVL